MKRERLIKIIIVALLIFVTFWFGLKPIFLGTQERQIKVQQGNFEKNEYATIVIGSEPEGIASALAAARAGLKTLLITEDEDLGSYLKQSMIAHMDVKPGFITKKTVMLNKGIYEEIFGKFTIGFNAEEYEESIRKLVEHEKNLDIVYGGMLLEAELDEDVLKGILVQQNDGNQYYQGHNFIDATQDGKLLVLCKTPYFKGSKDLGLPGYYAPLEFNFRVTGVDVGALKKSRKTTDLFDAFQLALKSYEKINADTKLISPSFVIQNDNDVVITGLKVYGVDVEDEQAMTEAFKAAEEEARMLTAFIKTVLVAFKDCEYKESPQGFFIPEYRHFEGHYRLTVSDILDNKDFPNKVALSAAPVDAGKYVDQIVEYIVTKPIVYAIPLECLIPSNLDNVLMIGAKGSYTSLAATSAGTLPTQMTIGESAGLISAYSFINGLSPADMLKLTNEQQKALKAYIKKAGIELSDFSESHFIPGTNDKLMDHWAYPYVKILGEYGLIAGGTDNNFRLDYRTSQDVMAVLIKNMILKMAPDSYHLNLDQALKAYEVKTELLGETAAAMVLETLSVPYQQGKALETLKAEDLLPETLIERLTPQGTVTMDVVLGLAVELIKVMKS